MKHYIKKMKLAIQISSVMACFSVLAAPNGPTGEFTKRGLVWSAQTSARINVINYYEFLPSSSRPLYFGITATPVNSSSTDCMRNIIVQKDGYYGVPIDGSNNNILLVIQNASAMGTGNYGGQNNFHGDVRWNNSGIFSIVGGDGNLSGGYAWCTANTTKASAFNDHDYAEFNGTISLYISPDAENKTYSFPETNLIKLVRTNINSPESMSIARLINQSTFKLAPSSNCTISTPPEIAFGEVNLWDFPGNTGDKPGGNRKDVLGSIDGSLTVDCTGGDSSLSIPAKLTLQGTIQTYATDLKMIMDSDGSVAPATVRAFIKNLYPPCSSNGVWFTHGSNGSENVVDINLQQGINTIPYRFSLCSLGEGYKQGSASGTATITLDWD